MRKISILITVLFVVCSAHGQTVQQIDQTLGKYMQRIHYWTDDEADNKPHKDDSLAATNDRLEKYLAQAAQNNLDLLQGNLPIAERNSMNIFTSDDKKVKLYSWNTWMGGTMVFFRNYIQYSAGSGTTAVNMRDTTSEGDPGGFYTHIYTIQTKENKTVYLVSMGTIGSGKDKGEQIAAYSIEDGRWVPIPFFQTTKKTLKSIEYGYDFFSIKENYEGRPQIHLNKEKTKLYIPIVNRDGGFTNGFLVYVFDGSKFVFNKNVKD